MYSTEAVPVSMAKAAISVPPSMRATASQVTGAAKRCTQEVRDHHVAERHLEERREDQRVDHAVQRQPLVVLKPEERRRDRMRPARYSTCSSPW